MLLAEAVGLGIVISLLLTETLGVAAGGIVVPGYVAFQLHHWDQVIGTLLAATITWAIVKGISQVALIYGRRLLVISILIGYILGYTTRIFSPITIHSGVYDLSAIGYVIPGLMAYWIERQGFYRTLTTLFIAAVLVRLVLAAITSGTVLP